MNSLSFISSALPLLRVQYHPNPISNRRVHPQRVVPRATSNIPQMSFQNVATYLLYTVTPLLLTDPLSTLAQTTQSTDGATKLDPTQITQADLDASLSSRILGWTAFVMLVIASVGAIILSFDNFIKSREDKKHRQWVQDRIDGRPYPKDFWSPDEDNTFSKGERAPAAGKGMNRESRRMEKRMRDKEQKEKKRREKLAKQRAAAKGEKDQTEN